MRKTCDLITGQINKADLKKIIEKNFWYKVETPAVFQTMHPYQIGFGFLANHFRYVYNTFIDFASRGYGWECINEADSLKVGKMLYEGFLKDENFIYKKQKAWRDDLAKLHRTAQKIHQTDLKKLSNRQLAKLYEDYLATFYYAWTIPLILEMNTVYVEQFLVPELKERLKLASAEFNEVLSVMSAPVAYSYLTLERIDFLKLALSFSKSGLEEHWEKCYWIKSSYRRMGNYSKTEIKKLLNNEIKKGKKHIKRELSELENLPKVNASRQLQIIKKYRISMRDQKLFKAMRIFGDWQDKRKEMNIYGNHHIFILLHEIAKRLDVQLDLLASAFPSETVEVLLGKLKFDRKVLRERFNFHLHAVNSRLEELFMTGNEAKFLKQILDKKIEERYREIKGMVTSMGEIPKIRGEVRVVFDPHGVDIPKGTILVSPMTRPDFVHLIHKAAAIITDQGGVTSHAAIIAREFGIPCIVGTGTATKLLKDGDIIEVDCTSGIVVKL